MKSSLEDKIAAVDQKIATVDQKVDRNTVEMRQGFQEAREHREALQKDLDATIHMLSKHEKKLARL